MAGCRVPLFKATPVRMTNTANSPAVTSLMLNAVLYEPYVDSSVRGLQDLYDSISEDALHSNRRLFSFLSYSSDDDKHHKRRYANVVRTKHTLSVCGASYVFPQHFEFIEEFTQVLHDVIMPKLNETFKPHVVMVFYALLYEMVAAQRPITKMKHIPVEELIATWNEYDFCECTCLKCIADCSAKMMKKIIVFNKLCDPCFDMHERTSFWKFKLDSAIDLRLNLIDVFSDTPDDGNNYFLDVPVACFNSDCLRVSRTIGKKTDVSHVDIEDQQYYRIISNPFLMDCAVKFRDAREFTYAEMMCGMDRIVRAHAIQMACVVGRRTDGFTLGDIEVPLDCVYHVVETHEGRLRRTLAEARAAEIAAALILEEETVKRAKKLKKEKREHAKKATSASKQAEAAAKRILVQKAEADARRAAEEGARLAAASDAAARAAWEARRAALEKAALEAEEATRSRAQAFARACAEREEEAQRLSALEEVALFDLLDFDALAGEMKVALEQLEMDANYEAAWPRYVHAC